MFKFYPFTFSPYVKHLTIFQLKIYFRKVLGTNGLNNWLDIRLKYEDTPLKATTKYGVMISDNSLLPCAFPIYFTAQYCLFIVHKRWTIKINIATAPSARWMFYLQSFYPTKLELSETELGLAWLAVFSPFNAVIVNLRQIMPFYEHVNKMSEWNSVTRFSQWKLTLLYPKSLIHYLHR